MNKTTNETEFRLLRELSNNGQLSQRELSRRVGISLGSINYLIKRFMEKGLIKAMRFKNSSNKFAYIYVLTPKGIEERINQTRVFLRKAYEEYIVLSKEVERLEGQRAKGEEKPWINQTEL